MTARPRSPKTRGTKGPKNGRHRTAVLLEEVRGQMQVVLERVGDTSTRGEVMNVVTRIESLDGRLVLVEDALRQTRRELGETRKELGGRLDGLEHEVRAVRQDVARQSQGAELRALDERMTAVERRLGM